MFCSKKKIKKISSENLPIKNRLAFIIGHTKLAKGAYSDFLKKHEYDFWKQFAETYLVSRNDVEIKVYYRDIIGVSGAYQKAIEDNPSAIIELHFNSFNGSASGFEILCNPNKDTNPDLELDFSRILIKEFSNVLKTKNRGVKHISSKGERGFFNLSQVVSIPSILIEPFFGDNEQDAMNAYYKQQQLADGIIKAFKVFNGLDT